MISMKNLTDFSQSLAEEIASLEELIAKAPEGNLISRKSKKGRYVYTKKLILEDGKVKEIYISNKNISEAEALAKKANAQKRLPALKQKKQLIDKLISLQSAEPAESIFRKAHPGFVPLLDSDLCKNESAVNWKNAPYNKSKKYPEQLKYPTVVKGLFVRSKSEADIIARLEHFGVPYHYDEVYLLNGVETAIDLTCLNINSNKIWYWDHRGMMDNLQYIQKTLNCESIFYNAGIIPWVNMIVTTETKDSPLDLQWVDALIRYYLL